MAYIRELSDEQATGRARELFDEDLQKSGYVWNVTRTLALRPDVVDAWRGLAAAIKSHMDLRRYELVTIAAARALRSSYCMLAHGTILRTQLFDDATVAAIAKDPATAGLTAAEVAMMEFAAQIARDAGRVTPADVDRLRAAGFADEEILDIAFAASARSFFTKTIDGLGIQPDAAYLASLDAALRESLVLGRPIAETVAR